MTQRQQAALETRRKITEAGLALVRRGGFAGASVEAITRAAGVAKGTFYVHFPTKEHLAAELCREPYEALSREVLASAGPLRRRLGRLFRGWAEIAEASGVEIAREWFRIAVRPAEAAELGLVFFDRDRAVVRTLLRDAVAAGELRPGAPVGSLADALSAQMQGLAAVWCMASAPAARLLPAVERFLRDHLPALLAPHLTQPTTPTRRTP